jgi:hypothetical protein
MKLLILLAFLCAPAFAADYVITKQNGVVSIEAEWGSWTGYISTPPKVLNGDKHTLSFDFTSPDYFSPENVGHFAIGVNGNGYTIEGRGIVIGNVSGYPGNSRGCFQTQNVNSITFESFWTTGNCVMGWAESELLKNDILYHVSISSEKSGVISYSLYQYIGPKKYLVSSQKTFDYSNNNSAVDNGGWFIAEVFSNHDWTMYLDNVTETEE